MRFSASVRSALFAGVAGVALPVSAFAQEAPETAADPAGETGEVAAPMSAGEPIVVTATKREMILQEAPVSVSVTSGETLERAEIRDLIDLQTVAPSLRVSQLQSSANTTFIIRGFGNGANNAGI